MLIKNTRNLGKICLALFLCACSVGALLAEERIKIGVSTALSGNAATYGLDLKNALLFANEKLSQNRYELIFEDDKCSGKDAVTVAQKLLNVDRVKYVLGFACSSTLLSSAPIYERAKVLAISSSAAAPKVSEAGDYIFRTWISDVHTSKALFDYVAKRHKTFGIISEQTDFAQGLKDAFIGYNSAGALKIVSEDYLTDDTNLKAQLTRLKSLNIDGLFLNTQTELTLSIVLKQVRQLGLQVPLYGAYFPGSQAFLNVSKDQAEGIIYVDVPKAAELMDEKGKKLFDEYVSKYGPPNTIDSIVVATFESFRALHEALESKQEPKDFLYHKTFDGLMGKWSFDSKGDIVGVSPVLRVIKNGAGVLL